MRCFSCDVALTDYEATRKDLHLEFIGMCNSCLSVSDMSDIYLLDRGDLKHDSDDITPDEGSTYLDDIITPSGGSKDD